jgi:hypothetical protein
LLSAQFDSLLDGLMHQCDIIKSRIHISKSEFEIVYPIPDF